MTWSNKPLDLTTGNRSVAVQVFQIPSMFTANIALEKTTTSQAVKNDASKSETAVDGKTWPFNFYTRFGNWPPWLMIDFGETMTIVKILLVHSYLKENMNKIVMAIGM